MTAAVQAMNLMKRVLTVTQRQLVASVKGHVLGAAHATTKGFIARMMSALVERANVSIGRKKLKRLMHRERARISRALQMIRKSDQRMPTEMLRCVLVGYCYKVVSAPCTVPSVVV